MTTVAQPAGPVAQARRPTPTWVLGTAGVVTMFVVWDLLVRSGAVSRDSLPYPGDTLARLAELLTDPLFLGQVVQTLWAWVISMLVASVVAVPLGLALGYFATLYRPASAVVHAARSVPSSAFLPVAILLFGLGTQMKVSLSVYAVFWPILLNAMYGVRDAEPLMLTAGRSMGWGQRRLLTRIVLPSAAPAIATGLRVASSTALIVVLSAELLGATSGVGTVITTYQEAQRPDYVYAGILIVGILGMLIYYGFHFAERLLVPWGHAQRGEGR
ncbi:ABC transporter permease [Streptosporangium sp. NPDC049644]|uniref:ABC transporter permease n=1 Tax=Streptosporangium sp. NPDC049644 TaxID=3155507 RepID=UPI003424441B